MDFNCTTDDPTASIALLHHQGSDTFTERPLTSNKLIRDGQVFTVLNIAVSDGGTYACSASDQSGTTITSSPLYQVLQRGTSGKGGLKFSGKLDQFASAYLGYSMDIDCTTDDPTASVVLLHNQGSGPLTERPLTPNKLILDGQVFTVLNITVSDGGQYACRAADQSGTTITSRRLFRVLRQAQLPKQFELVPNKPLIIFRQGHNQSIICQALQKGFPFDLTWEKQTSAGSYGSVDPSMVKRYQSNLMVRTILTIANAKLSDSGIYKCTVAVKHKSTFKLASVKVKGTEALKFIGKLDQFASAYLGFSMDFNCTTDGPTASIALLHHQGSDTFTERPLTSNKLIRDGQVFTVLNIAVSDGGTYACRASDQSGTTITSSRLFRVLQRAELPKDFGLVPNKALIMTPGQNQSIICQARQGGLQFVLTWEKRTSAGSYVSVDPSMVKKDRSNEMQRAILTVANAKLSDSGIFKCTVSVTATQRSTFKLTSVDVVVPSAPTITKPTTRDRVVLDGQEQTLHCDAGGFPKPVVTWYKNGQQLKKKQCTKDPGSCQDVYDVSEVGDGSPILTEGRLKIVSALYPRDNGEFKCVASNGNSPTAELIFNLNVTGMWDRMTLILY
ncbi:PREDICTED: hemicentin-2-like isoform X2 [Acropora digitifera]|uniref:hemicentin-2-like isoform X2 n=1 Tax=Acropora digitifera TaxID=70779 RepID=UPI00077A6629|nr:PREDICTED: hemicentin-2-like isoform X2 [Acropora digitifera]